MRHIKSILSRAGIDFFIVLLVASVSLAWLFPDIGAGEGMFSISWFANCGISVIFFFYGLKLNVEKLRADISNWRLHILVHAATFILFPLLTFLIRPLFYGENNLLLWVGIFYLAALPSTVSSSVVMVSIAKGNVPAAIFNASISSLIGIFITPLWMSAILSGSAEINIAGLWSIVVKLVLQLLLPLIAGILLNNRWGSFALRHQKKLRIFDQSVILLIVYTSFCSSFAMNLFSGFSKISIITCAVGMLVLFFVVFGIVSFICRHLKLNREDTITAQFCGSKKSLMHGSAMAKVIFSGYGGIGVILLPLMLYHSLQLIIVSAMARKFQMR